MAWKAGSGSDSDPDPIRIRIADTIHNTITIADQFLTLSRSEDILAPANSRRERPAAILYNFTLLTSERIP
jgi:hypothetical protein